MPKKFNGREYLLSKLKEWGLEPIRMGGLEYIVATNLMVVEEIQKLNGLLRSPKKKKDVSMLDY